MIAVYLRALSSSAIGERLRGRYAESRLQDTRKMRCIGKSRSVCSLCHAVARCQKFGGSYQTTP